MSKFNRREFLDRSATAGLGLAAAGAIATSTQKAKAVSANDKIVLAIIGVRGRGSSLGPAFAARVDCEVAYLAAVDASLLG